MIIAISGKIGSGKDTVGRIIQYLTMLHSNIPIKKCTFEEFCKSGHGVMQTSKGDMPVYNYWQIKKFAGKLKQIVSILTGISVEDLEKQEVKGRVLGEEWDRTINNGFKVNLPNEMRKITVRQMLQWVGTDAMRNVIHPNVWVNALFVDYNDTERNQYILDASNLEQKKFHQIGHLAESKWIITDMRFPNEMEAVKSRNGITIRVNRNLYFYCGQTYDWDTLLNVVFKDTVEKPTLLYANNHWLVKNNHESETALDNAEFNYIIDNNGTIEELIEKVKQILIKEKII